MKKFNYVPVEIKANLETKEIDGKRFYVTESGSAFPSVTTVTGWEKRAFFAEWRRKNPDESKRVLRRGTRFHSMVETYLKNQPIIQSEYTPKEYYLICQFKPLLEHVDNIHALETAMYSNLLNLAGRVDCIAEYDGVLSVIDFKTCTAEKEKKDIHDYFVQATAYAIMFKELTGIPVKQIVILLNGEDGSTASHTENPIRFTKSLKISIDKFLEYSKSNK